MPNDRTPWYLEQIAKVAKSDPDLAKYYRHMASLTQEQWDGHQYKWTGGRMPTAAQQAAADNLRNWADDALKDL